MSEHYTVSLQKIIDSHGLETIYLPQDANDILIETNEVNRPVSSLRDIRIILIRAVFKFWGGRNSVSFKI